MVKSLIFHLDMQANHIGGVAEKGKFGDQGYQDFDGYRPYPIFPVIEKKRVTTQRK